MQLKYIKEENGKLEVKYTEIMNALDRVNEDKANQNQNEAVAKVNHEA